MLSIVLALTLSPYMAILPSISGSGIYDTAASYDLSIVQLDQNLGLDLRNVILAPGQEIQVYEWVDRLRVLDTTDSHGTSYVRIVMSTEADVKFPPIPGSVVSPIEAGRRYLLFSKRTDDPDWIHNFGFDSVYERPKVVYHFVEGSRKLQRKSDEEIQCLELLPTQATRVSGGSDPTRRLAASLADCFIGADAFAASRVCPFLYTSRWPEYNWGLGAKPIPLPEPPMSLRLRQIAADSPPPIRYRIYRLLNDWQIAGTERPLMQAILACATSPDQFDQEGDQLGMPQYIRASRNTDVDAAADHGLVDPEQWYQAVTHATNVRIRNLLLCANVVATLSPERETVIAGFLNQPNAMIQRFVVYHLAANLKDTVHLPHSQEVRHGNEVVTEWPDLDEMVAYWRNYYHIPPP